MDRSRLNFIYFFKKHDCLVNINNFLPCFFYIDFKKEKNLKKHDFLKIINLKIFYNKKKLFMSGLINKKLFLKKIIFYTFFINIVCF